MGPREIAAFLQAPNRLLNTDEVVNCNNEETKALHDELVKRLISSESPCSINMVGVTSGNLSAAARRSAEGSRSRKLTLGVRGKDMEVTVTLECLDLSDLYERHNQQTGEASEASCDFTFQLEPGTYHQISTVTEYPTLSMTVPVKQIIDVFAIHHFEIFRFNPRGPLGSKVNNLIKSTLLDEDSRQRFHLLNNGITAICRKYTIEEKEEQDLLSVLDFQIINGCQTAVTLWDARAAIQGDPNVLVTVKLIQCAPEFGETIARSTNRQNALRAEDFISNDNVQRRLQNEFAALMPPWFYEIKRGQWNRIGGGAPLKETYRNPDGRYRKLTSKEVAQAVVSFSGFPGEAKDKIRNFLNKETVPSIARESEFSYDVIYTEDVTAVQLLLPTMLQDRVWKQVEIDKQQDPWLEYARFHIVWLMGELLKGHYQIYTNLLPSHLAAITCHQINNWFEQLYRIARAAIRNALRVAENAGIFTGNNREFFRSAANYRLIESNSQGMSETMSADGATFANLPPV